jgi:transposase
MKYYLEAMRRSIPKIKETAQVLENRARKEKDPKLKIRLNMLVLLLGGKAKKRRQVADQLAVHRNTVGRWLRSYEEGGIDNLLEINSPAHKREQRSIPQEGFEALKERLAQPGGFSSYREIQLWLHDTYDLEINYVTLHQIVRYRLRAKPKVARESHIKKA